MELHGGAAQPDGTQPVYQRIYNDAVSFENFEDRLAGAFVFHPTHGHIHFEGFTRYNLRTVLPNDGVGEVVASAEKVSFCLLDLDGCDTPIIGAPERSRYPSCGTVQGISVGWADVYEEGLPDQWIDVTGVPYGEYWLEVVADPDNHLLELDESNNAARILIDYSPTTALPVDRYEPNDGGQAVYRLIGDATVRLDGLSIHSPGNDDFFVWKAPRAGVLTAETLVNGTEGDLNLFVYTAPVPEEIGLGISTGDSERVVAPVSAGQDYYLRVIGAGDDMISDYTLALSVADEELVHPKDAFEPNNNRNTAPTLPTTDVALTDLTIHSVIDVDYFRWIAPADGTVSVSADSSQADGDLILSLLDLEGFLLASSTETTLGEKLSLAVRSGYGYLIKAAGVPLETQSSYSLNVSFTNMPAIFGDFNADGTVDAADYVVWRNGLGTTYTQTDYNTWRANFGRSAAAVAFGATAGLSSTANPAVPEPTSLTLAALVLVPTLWRYRDWGERGRSLSTSRPSRFRAETNRAADRCRDEQ
jgi:hypothetical protein